MAFTNTNHLSGIAFEKTLFGSILSSSCAPNNLSTMTDGDTLFSNPVGMSHSDVERAEHTAASVSIHLLHSYRHAHRLTHRLAHRLSMALPLWSLYHYLYSITYILLCY